MSTIALCLAPLARDSDTIGLRLDSDPRSTSVAGRVIDATGAVIVNATIRLREMASGRVHLLRSGADGQFSLEALSPGQYRVEMSSPGFQSAGLEFAVNEHERAVLSARLMVGMQSQQVTVESSVTAVQTQSSALGSVTGVPQMMPLNGRNYTQLLTLSAGAVPRMKTASASATPGAADTHVRSWFPESLYIAPEIITDRDGRASITIPIADNITTWRMAMTASTKSGALGSGTTSLKVFQDFFTEMDLPVTLTQGDEVSIPVAIYNYSGSRGNVRLHLEQNEWFSLDGDAAEKTVAVESNRVGASQFTIEAKHIGKFKLTLRSELDGGAKRADIVVREIEVVPNGREQTIAFNGRVESAASHTVTFPATALPEASTVLVRLYPGPLSQVVEGMDSLLRMPYGCFEQTSSSTYPNILALDYMKRTKKRVPEVGAKAESFIATGYQRLLTFEVRGGGFSWFGQAPANKILTAYGLMEFSDMSKRA